LDNVLASSPPAGRMPGVHSAAPRNRDFISSFRSSGARVGLNVAFLGTSPQDREKGRGDSPGASPTRKPVALLSEMMGSGHFAGLDLESDIGLWAAPRLDLIEWLTQGINEPNCGRSEPTDVPRSSRLDPDEDVPPKPGPADQVRQMMRKSSTRLIYSC